MNYSMIKVDGRVPNRVIDFVVDEATDVASIDTTFLSPGSKVFVIDDSQWYMLKHTKAWKPVDWNSSGGGSTEEIIYNGGTP